MNSFKWAKEILVGLLIGIANIIPGVSGGTIALSMGAYEKIISSVNNLFKDFKKSIMTLIPYGIGAVLGIAGLSFVIEFLFKSYPLQTSLGFSGLILGGLPAILKHLKGKKIKVERVIVFLILFGLVAFLPLIGTGQNEINLSISTILIIKLFFVGVIASATMVIPGVSGSMILMLMGYYEPLIQKINLFIKSAISFNINNLLSSTFVLFPFVLGVLVGIFLIAKLVEILFKKFKTITFFGILGLVLASPIAILSNINKESINLVSILMGLAVFISCFYISMAVGEE